MSSSRVTIVKRFMVTNQRSVTPLSAAKKNRGEVVCCESVLEGWDAKQEPVLEELTDLRG